jgi:DNA-directed RNA polymerase specialized sigma24 family protein
MDTQDDGFELFRRAIQERDAEAWAAIAVRYRRLLIAWAVRCPAAQIAEDSYEDLADRALGRAWAALSSERFAAFPSLPALLAYLHTCVTATAIDAARACIAYERVAQLAGRTDPTPLEQIILERLDRVELWRIVASLVRTEAERVVLNERFVQNLPPRTILARHSTLFADAVAVYTAIKNLCDRLRRSPEMRRFYDELRAA